MITTNRNVFLGIHVTQRVKDALLKEVDSRRTKEKAKVKGYEPISMSSLGYNLLRESLIREGHDLETDEVI